MTYKITSTRQADITLITTVEYNFDGVLHTIEIPHFMPKTEAEIEQNIINAAQSELARLQALIGHRMVFRLEYLIVLKMQFLMLLQRFFAQQVILV